MRKQYIQYDDDKAKLDILFIILSLFAAAGAALAAGFCYKAVLYDLILPVRVGVTFLVFTAVLLFLVLILSLVTRRFKEYVIDGDRSVTSVMLPLLGVILGVGLVAGVVQFIYGLNITADVESQDFTSQIYLVDNSGSMDWNDPNDNRYSAIQSLIGEKRPDYPYMIYSFGNTAEVMRPMGPADDTSIQTSNPDVGGGTDVEYALRRVYDDYANGVWNGGTRPQVILITDGESFDSMANNPVLQNYVTSGIPVSTVHLIAENSEPLIDIANQTGGQFVKVEDVSLMDVSLKEAVDIYQTEERSLLENRSKVGGGWLYGVLRVVAVALLGAGIGFGVLLAYGRHESGKLTLISMPIKALVTAVAYELLMELLPSWNYFIVCMGMFVLLGIAIVGKGDDYAMSSTEDDDDFGGSSRSIGGSSSRRRRRR